MKTWATLDKNTQGYFTVVECCFFHSSSSSYQSLKTGPQQRYIKKFLQLKKWILNQSSKFAFRHTDRIGRKSRCDFLSVDYEKLYL